MIKLSRSDQRIPNSYRHHPCTGYNACTRKRFVNNKWQFDRFALPFVTPLLKVLKSGINIDPRALPKRRSQLCSNLRYRTRHASFRSGLNFARENHSCGIIICEYDRANIELNQIQRQFTTSAQISRFANTGKKRARHDLRPNLTYASRFGN